MKLSRFVGVTTREVMRQVREALGPDALIISNRSVAEGIEVIAAPDPAPQDAPLSEPARYGGLPPENDGSGRVSGSGLTAPAKETPHGEWPRPEFGASLADAPDMPMRAAWTQDGAPAVGEAAMQAAIDALRISLEGRMDGLLWANAQGAGREPVAAALFRKLLEAGFSMPLVRALVQRIPQGMDGAQALAWARNELVTHLPVLRDENAFLGGGGVYALVGPTGVGKTTTLAKLAARFIAREGREQVAMLTTDLFRIGAAEQLQIYGRLLGVPALSVRDAAELREALGRLGQRRVILIDTTGLSQRDRSVAEQAALLHAAGQPVHRLLVLDATSQGDTLDEVAHAYRHGADADVIGCILTKLDESRRLGPALDTAIRHRLPIHYVSMGQRVPEHLGAVDPHALVTRAFEAATEGKLLFAPSEADLAALLRGSEGQAPDVVQRRRLLAEVLGRHAAGENLDAALNWLDSDAACQQACANWRAGKAASGPPAAEAMRDETLALARQHYAQACDRFLIVSHGKAALQGHGLPGAFLLPALLMSDRGQAFCAPVSHLKLPHGMVSAHAPAQPLAGGEADALMHRIDVLRSQLSDVPQVHLFEQGTAALWLALRDSGASWVARVPGMQRVLQDDCATTVAASARELGYLPAGEVADARGRRLALWASGTEVSLVLRGRQVLPLRLVCARLVDGNGGEVVRQLYGLTSVKLAQADAISVARWLVTQDQAKSAFRYMAQAWAVVSPTVDTHVLARQTLLATQLGAACWQLSRGPEAARGLVLAGRSAVRLPDALLRCFAMLEMVAK